MDRITPARRSANMSAIKGKDTKPEVAVRRFLHGQGFRFRLHGKGLLGRPDVVLARYRSAILVHGCFWHMHDCPEGRVRPKTNAEFWENKRRKNVERDRANLAALRRLGWRVRVIWECKVESGAFRRGLCAWLAGGLPTRS